MQIHPQKFSVEVINGTLLSGLQKSQYRPKLDVHFVLITRGGIEVMNDAVSESWVIFVLLSVIV